jgi:hypothetical protein
MANGLPWVGSGGRAPSARDFYPPAPGSHNPSTVTEAANRDEAIPGSNSPGPRGHSTEITSRQGARSQAHTGTSSEAHESLDKNWPADYLRRPSLMR